MLALFSAQKNSLPQSEAARLLLAQALYHTAGLVLPEVACDTYGKPYFPTLPHVHFSLSHSGDYVVCALSDAAVGVDIEQMRPLRPGIKERVCTPRERECFDFFSAWVLKESFIKWSGDTSRRLRTIEFLGSKRSASVLGVNAHGRVYDDIEGYRVGIYSAKRRLPRTVQMMALNGDAPLQKKTAPVTIMQRGFTLAPLNR